MTPSVSVLVPTFNRRDLVSACLRSALGQSMGDLEVIVVDGASTDGTWEVCESFARRDSRVRAYRDPVNLGPVPGWWRCVEEARGRYATFLWSDDLLLPDFLRTTIDALEAPDVALAFTAAEIGAEPGQGAVHYQGATGRIRTPAFIDRMLTRDGTLPVSPACALFRLSDLRDAFSPELPTSPPADLRSTGAGVDVLMFLRTAERYPLVARIGEPLAFFRSHPGSITMDGRAGRVELDYVMALAWYAATRGRPSVAARIVTRHWLREARRTRHVPGAIETRDRYHGIIDRRRVIMTAPGVVARAASERLHTMWTRRAT